MRHARGRPGDALATGKLPPRLLERLLRWRGAPDRRVLVGPGCGVDAAVVAVGRHRVILKADPVTFTARRVGWYAVQVNANDVAVMGGRPAWFQPTILVPPGTRASMVMAIAREIDRACRALGVAVTGGHTEVTDAVTRPVVAGDMQGLLVAPRIITAAGARPGDRLLITKAAGIEGTAILAQERGRELASVLPAVIMGSARRLRQRPGISIVPEAVIAARYGASAMHDPTEGGVRAGLHEIAFASRVRLDVDLECVPVLPPTAEVCRHYGIDPLGLIGSGALLVTVPALGVPSLLRAWARKRIAGRVIGSVEAGRGVRARRQGRRVPFPWLARDEIITALARDEGQDDRLQGGKEDDMSTAGFYRTVMTTSGNDNRELAKRATAAVFRALRDRLTREEADQVVAQLPQELKEVWEEGERSPQPVKLHRAEFFERVKEAAGLPSTKEARWVTLAVFAALKEQLSPGESEDVWAQLPKDLKELWAEAQTA